MSRRITLPFRVLGKSFTNLIDWGRTDFPNASTTRSLRAVSSLGPSAEVTQKHTIACPLTGSGMPMAAAADTPECSTSMDSISAGPIRLPATLIVSSERPQMYQYPSASIAAQSPCTQTSGICDQYVCR